MDERAQVGAGHARLHRWIIEALGRLNDALDRSAAEASRLNRQLVVYTRWLIVLFVVLTILGAVQLLWPQFHFDLRLVLHK